MNQDERAPVRVQLRRTRGWRLQEVAPGAVKVDRSTQWGNRYRPGGPVFRNKGFGKVRDAAEAVILFRKLQAPHMDDVARLRGKDLACWCALDAPCHADVLIELANKPIQCAAHIPPDALLAKGRAMQ